MIRFVLCIVLGASLFSAPLAPVAAQETGSSQRAWNGERALELVRRAQARRAEAITDTALLSYQADARAYVYFYLDRQDTGERNLVRTDQLALEVYWRAPDLTKQRIVGWRDRESLPTNINYHIDHLAVVMENFGDVIRIGDGDEVRNVLHPVASGAESFYEYRLVDSLTLRLPGAPEPVRVYELEVRPRDLSEPAFLGSIFVERRAGDLVRMDFTFTPSAYVDQYLDYISISLDNGLWKGRFWLPNEQRLEIRREIPLVDLPVGSVIRGTMKVTNYQFNEPLPLALFTGRPVVLAPERERESFQFEHGIHAELREEGIGPEAELSEIRRQARRMMIDRALSGLGGLRTPGGLGGVRLWLPGASEVFRYNRAEGAVVSLGPIFSPGQGIEIGALAGWAFGADHPLGALSIGGVRGALDLRLSAYGNRPRDLAITPVVAGAVNSVSAVLAGRDYLDPLYASGLELEARRRLPGRWTVSALARGEAQRSAELTTDFSVFAPADNVRPVRAIDEGTMWEGAVRLERDAAAEVGAWWTVEVNAEAGLLDPEDSDLGTLTFARSRLSVGWGRRWAEGARLDTRVRAGAGLGDLPRQALFLLGGRGTLPGYRFRGFGGDRFLIGDVVASFDLASGWLSARALAAVGWADVGEAGSRALELWGAEPTDDVLPSVGVGLGIFNDILQIDVARGLDEDGEWELIVGTQRSFWDFL